MQAESQEKLSDSLEQLHGALATLGAVIPRVDDPLDKMDFPVDSMVNPSYPMSLQPFLGIDDIKENFEMGHEWTFGCLAPLLLAAAFRPDNERIDFKAYSNNFISLDHSLILTIGHVDHNSDKTEDDIKTWIEKCDLPNSRKNVLVSRCLVVNFSTRFNHFGVTKFPGSHAVNYKGHAITLGLELENRVLTLKIYDGIVSKYVYAVHDQLFQWMINAVKLHNRLYDSLRTELVYLTDRLHVDGLFMTCMSVAYRVCLYLSKSKKIEESEDDFTEDTLNFKKHIFRMIKWVRENKQIKNHENAVLLSPAMDKSVYEINKENCYFVMAPYNGKRTNGTELIKSSVLIKQIDEKFKKRLRYSLENGFQATEEDTDTNNTR